jgi:hypothetical protein
MVMYAWAVAQDYFREMTDQNVREELYEKDKSQLEEDMAPFGFIVDGNDEEVIVEKEKGLVWTMASDWKEDARWEKYRERVEDVSDVVGLEYGLTNSEWEWN